MSKELYACIECGFETPKWMGKCTSCGNWGSLKRVENTNDSKKSKAKKAKLRKISSFKSNSKARVSTLFQEFDRVLGGGFVEGEVILVGGEPGVGKTSILLQLLNNIHVSKRECIYISAEESQEQLSIHANRLGVSDKLGVICDDDIDSIIATLTGKKLSLVILDSIQTVRTSDLKGLPGGVGQVKESTSRIVEYAKKNGVAVILVGHITKGGELAGPKVIEHIVDAVFYLEGSSDSSVRILRGVKNRFGSTREIGVFKFEKGRFSDANNPSEMFILSSSPRVGICKGVVFEGRRAILVEVQALTSPSTFSIPQRVVSGVRKSKVQMLCAVLSKYTKANFLDKDVYINIANGLKINDSSLDLSICIALLSSYFDKTVSPSKVAIGEVSLTGQVYSTGSIQDKVKALSRLGYKDVLLPKGAQKGVKRSSKTGFIDSISELIKRI
ncbi:DNA repair protein RadA [Patescibacteria group bacterium]